MNNFKHIAIAAAITFAAAGAYAEGGIGGGDGVGDGTAGSNAGTTGWLAETLHGSTVGGSRILAADGSNSMQGGVVYAGTRTTPNAPNTTALGASSADYSQERDGNFFKWLFRR